MHSKIISFLSVLWPQIYEQMNFHQYFVRLFFRNPLNFFNNLRFCYRLYILTPPISLFFSMLNLLIAFLQSINDCFIFYLCGGFIRFIKLSF